MPKNKLTSTQTRVLIALTEGHTARSGSKVLGMKRDTFRVHTQSIHVRLGAHTNAQAVARGYQLGILCAPSPRSRRG